MRGRKRLPLEIKQARGTLQKCREVPNPPVPTGELGAPPEWFDKEHLSVWKKAVAASPDGVLKAGNESTLESWVCAYIAHKKARCAMQKEPLLIEDSAGRMKPNPLDRIARDNAVIMLRCASELGFTPSSRGRINVVKNKKKSDNPFAQLVSINGGKTSDGTKRTG